MNNKTNCITYPDQARIKISNEKQKKKKNQALEFEYIKQE